MTTYPGENPQPPEGSDPGSDDPADAGTEPTQPVGYWERQAAEQARQPDQQGYPYAAPGGPVFNPTTTTPPSGQPTRPYEQNPYGQNPYGQQQPYGQPAYGQPTQGQPFYGQPSYGQPPAPGQPGPVGAPGYPPYAAFTPHRPDHPQSNTSLILGIVGLVGGFMCGLGFILSPFAWALGRSALKEIAASQGRLGGEGTARAGMITGIVGTVLLCLGVLALIAIALLFAFGGMSSDGSSV